MADLTTLLTTPQDEQKTTEQSLELALKEVFSSSNLEMKTELNQRQIVAITRGKIFAKEFKSRLMANLVKQYITLMISKNRLGRKEFVDMASNMNRNKNEENGVLKKLIGV